MSVPSSSTPSTSLRPRARRRTDEDDGDGGGGAANGSPPLATSAPQNPYTSYNNTSASSLIDISRDSSRGASPTRMTSRTAKSTGNADRMSSSMGTSSLRGEAAGSFFGAVAGSNGATPKYRNGKGGSVRNSTNWETPWLSIQNLAADIFGGDKSRGSSPAGSPRRRRTGPSNTSAGSAGRWGPAAPHHYDRELGAGTKERRRMELEAKKRERLLLANGRADADVTGNFKRRGSDEYEPHYRDHTGSVPSGEMEDRDTMVYVHPVKPSDTLAGIAIKYNCSLNIFRNANRLWPNDSVQVRKIVVLPVDACGVRGKKIADSELHQAVGAAVGSSLSTTRSNLGLDAAGTERQDPSAWSHWSSRRPSRDRGNPDSRTTPSSSIPTSPSMSATLSNSEEPPWQHDSWVLIEGFPEAIEIARMSRRTLGYFPRSRRKSQSFSDAGNSFELLRPKSFREGQSSTVKPDAPAAGAVSSSPQSQTSNQRARPGLSRAYSGSASASASNRNSLASMYMQRPGGVGTMGRNVRTPGPANDGLNKMFPSILEARLRGGPESWQASSASNEFLDQRSSSSPHHRRAHSDSPADPSGPRYDAYPSSHGNTNSLENFGGAIEGWVRKLATRTSHNFNLPGSSSGAGGAGSSAAYASAGIGECRSSTAGHGGGLLSQGSGAPELIELSEDVFDGQQQQRQGTSARGIEEEGEDPFAPRGRVFTTSPRR